MTKLSKVYRGLSIIGQAPLSGWGTAKIFRFEAPLLVPRMAIVRIIGYLILVLVLTFKAFYKGETS